MPTRTLSQKVRARCRNWVGRTWLRVFGWEVEGGHPNVAKAILVAAPHTSGWDLPFTLAVAWSLDLEMSWVGKRELFSPQWGWFFRFLGGVSVDRAGSKGFVSAVADLLRNADELHIVIAPEGTRGKAARWKTGFYYMAKEANVPIVLAYLDYSRKRGGLGHVFVPTGDPRKDLGVIRDFYANIKGKFPDQASEIKLDEETFATPVPAESGETIVAVAATA